MCPCIVPGIMLMSNGSLYISVLDRKDGGTYTCLAENSAGSDAKDIRLKVLGRGCNSIN